MYFCCINKTCVGNIRSLCSSRRHFTWYMESLWVITSVSTETNTCAFHSQLWIQNKLISLFFLELKTRPHWWRSTVFDYPSELQKMTKAVIDFDLCNNYDLIIPAISFQWMRFPRAIDTSHVQCFLPKAIDIITNNGIDILMKLVIFFEI